MIRVLLLIVLLLPAANAQAQKKLPIGDKVYGDKLGCIAAQKGDIRQASEAHRVHVDRFAVHRLNDRCAFADIRRTGKNKWVAKLQCFAGGEEYISSAYVRLNPGKLYLKTTGWEASTLTIC